MSTISIFFSGIFRIIPPGPDPDARIGYCASKKQAYVGYKCHLLCTSEDMTALDFIVTPANMPDSKLFIPLFSRMYSTNIGTLIKKIYGDNAYDSKINRDFLEEREIVALFHTKEETGKNPVKSRSARKKSKKRSRIEVMFGIAHQNLGFGRVNVRRLPRVIIDTSFIFIAWNLGILYSYHVDQVEDRISLKALLYKN